MPIETEFTGISERPLFGETKYRVNHPWKFVLFNQTFFSSGSNILHSNYSYQQCICPRKCHIHSSCLMERDF